MKFDFNLHGAVIKRKIFEDSDNRRQNLGILLSHLVCPRHRVSLNENSLIQKICTSFIISRNKMLFCVVKRFFLERERERERERECNFQNAFSPIYGVANTASMLPLIF